MKKIVKAAQSSRSSDSFESVRDELHAMVDRVGNLLQEYEGTDAYTDMAAFRDRVISVAKSADKLWDNYTMV